MPPQSSLRAAWLHGVRQRQRPSARAAWSRLSCPNSPRTHGRSLRVSGSAQFNPRHLRLTPTTQHSTGTWHWTADTAKLSERVGQMWHSIRFSRNLILGGCAIGLGGIILVIVNWGDVRSSMSRESAEVISETIRDKQLQSSAQELSKELLNQLLHDEELTSTVSSWIYKILVSRQDEIGMLFVHILGQEQVVAAVNRLADRLVEYLCASEQIQAKVGRLLVDAICLDASRNAAAQWAIDLVLQDDVTMGFRDLVVAALQTTEVVDGAGLLALQVVNRVLQDPETLNEAKQALHRTLRDSQLRATAKESLWNIVLPWGSGRTQDKGAQKTMKSVDDLIALESLTLEERQVLRSLQARLHSAADGSAGSNSAAHKPAAKASSDKEAVGVASPETAPESTTQKPPAEPQVETPTVAANGDTEAKIDKKEHELTEHTSNLSKDAKPPHQEDSPSSSQDGTKTKAVPLDLKPSDEQPGEKQVCQDSVAVDVQLQASSDQKKTVPDEMQAAPDEKEAAPDEKQGMPDENPTPANSAPLFSNLPVTDAKPSLATTDGIHKPEQQTPYQDQSPGQPL